MSTYTSTALPICTRLRGAPSLTEERSLLASRISARDISTRLSGYLFDLLCGSVLSSLTESTSTNEASRAPALSAISLLVDMTLNAQAPLPATSVLNLFSAVDNLVGAGKWAG